MRNLIEEARICHGEHTTHGKFIQELADHAERLEAKLATAVEALQKIANRPAEMIWGEDEEVRDAMRFMEKEAEAALAAIQKAKQ